MEKRYKYIIVEGPIGVGKTTVSEMLRKRFNAKLILENFMENPMIVKFYEDIKHYAFNTEIFFLITRYQQQIKEVQELSLFNSYLVSDYLFQKNKIFAYMNLNDKELPIFEKIYKSFEPDILKPDLVIYLKATTETLLERIKKRGRDFEKSISRDYLQTLNIAYNHFFKYYALSPVYSLDTTDLNLPDDEEARNMVLDTIEGLLDGKDKFAKLILENNIIMERNN